MTYLAVDPGAKTVGWARFDDHGEVTGLGSKKVDVFLDWLEEQPPKKIIVEGYFVNPFKHKSWAPSGTSETIGAIKRFARKHNIEVIEQRNTDLPIGLRLIGMYGAYYSKGGKNVKHVDDEISALAHGTVYMTKNKIKRPQKGAEWL